MPYPVTYGGVDGTTPVNAYNLQVKAAEDGRRALCHLNMDNCDLRAVNGSIIVPFSLLRQYPSLGTIQGLPSNEVHSYLYSTQTIYPPNSITVGTYTQQFYGGYARPGSFGSDALNCRAVAIEFVFPNLSVAYLVYGCSGYMTATGF
jgi:hypothetical protein